MKTTEKERHQLSEVTARNKADYENSQLLAITILLHRQKLKNQKK